jgi:hypothetical protein
MQELTLALHAAEARATKAEQQLMDMQNDEKPFHHEERVSTEQEGVSTEQDDHGFEVLEGPECELDDDEFFDAVVRCAMLHLRFSLCTGFISCVRDCLCLCMCACMCTCVHDEIGWTTTVPKDLLVTNSEQRAMIALGL